MSRARRVAVVLGALAAVVAVAWAVLFFTPAATVREIRVAGVLHADEAAVREASGVREGQRMLRVDTAGAAAAVAGQPWVRRATVARAWPRGIRIEVVEHAPALFLRDADGDRIFDEAGTEFLRGPAPEGTPELAGAPAGEAGEVVGEALELLRALPGELRGRLTRVEAPGPNAITLVFDGDREMYAGSADQAAAKAVAIRDLLGRPERSWNVADPRRPATREVAGDPAGAETPG